MEKDYSTLKALVERGLKLHQKRLLDQIIDAEVEERISGIYRHKRAHGIPNLLSNDMLIFFHEEQPFNTAVATRWYRHMKDKDFLSRKRKSAFDMIDMYIHMRVVEQMQVLGWKPKTKQPTNS